MEVSFTGGARRGEWECSVCGKVVVALGPISGAVAPTDATRALMDHHRQHEREAATRQRLEAMPRP